MDVMNYYCVTGFESNKRKESEPLSSFRKDDAAAECFKGNILEKLTKQ